MCLRDPQSPSQRPPQASAFGKSCVDACCGLPSWSAFIKWGTSVLHCQRGEGEGWREGRKPKHWDPSHLVPRENCFGVGIMGKGIITGQRLPQNASLPLPLSALSLFKSLQVRARLAIYEVFCFADTLRSYLGGKELRGLQIACWLKKRVSRITNTEYFAVSLSCTYIRL